MLTKNDVTFYDPKQTKINKKVHTVSDDENIIKVIIKTLCPKRFLNNQAQ